MANKRSTTESDKEGGKSELIQRSVWVTKDLWLEARRRTVGDSSLSEVIRKLLRGWLDGKFDIDNIED